jgi:hypothetical protein
MAVHFQTSRAKELLEAIRSAISDGQVRTWSFDSDGDFTHNTDQWRFKAWLRPKALSTELALHILTPKGQRLSRETYAIYHARFVEMALAHFDELFDSATTSALPQTGDIVRPPAL